MFPSSHGGICSQRQKKLGFLPASSSRPQCVWASCGITEPALALKSFDLKPPLNTMASPPVSSPHPKIKAKSFEVSHVVK